MNEQESFIAYNGIESEIISYNITYTTTPIQQRYPYDYHNLCVSTIIPAHSCKGVCKHEFNVSASSCPLSADIALTIAAAAVFANSTLNWERKSHESNKYNRLAWTVIILSLLLICMHNRAQKQSN